jgi:hypothetical protein
MGFKLYKQDIYISHDFLRDHETNVYVVIKQLKESQWYKLFL